MARPERSNLTEARVLDRYASFTRALRWSFKACATGLSDVLHPAAIARVQGVSRFAVRNLSPNCCSQGRCTLTAHTGKIPCGPRGPRGRLCTALRRAQLHGVARRVTRRLAGQDGLPASTFPARLRRGRYFVRSAREQRPILAAADGADGGDWRWRLAVATGADRGDWHGGAVRPSAAPAADDVRPRSDAADGLARQGRQRHLSPARPCVRAQLYPPGTGPWAFGIPWPRFLQASPCCRCPGSCRQ